MNSQSRSFAGRIPAAIMVCNPFLLLSPVFLLYGMYRAVVSPNLFATDTGNTIFNFIALDIYVLLVCVTSTLLARRAIMPDTVMLLLVHAILFVAPFILIAHGVFLDGAVPAALGAFGLALGLCQLQVLRKRLPGSFLSPQLLIGGALILAANFAAPMIFRNGLEKNNEAWGAMGGLAWNLFLPALAAWMNLLPTNRKPVEGAAWTQPWFGLLIYFLWLAGSAVQLWTVAYVDDRQLYAHQFTVALWVVAWTAVRKASILPAYCAARTREIAPFAAVFIPALGAVTGLDLNIAALLFTLNLPLLLLVGTRPPVLAMSGLSMIGLLCCVPLEWFGVGVSRIEFASLLMGAALLGGLAIVRDARAGTIAALGVAYGLGVIGEYSVTVTLSCSVGFLFLHQLRWANIGAPERFLLCLAGIAWIAQSAGLELRSWVDAQFPRMVAMIVAVIALRQASLGHPGSVIVPVCAVIVLCLQPAHLGIITLAEAPSGLLPILAGFAFLGLGVWRSLRVSRT